METPNLSYIKELSGGDTDFEQKILHILHEEFPQEKEAFYTYLKQKDFGLAADLVHKLKHKVSILGLTQGYTLATLFEEELREGNLQQLDQFDGVLSSITQFLDPID